MPEIIVVHIACAGREEAERIAGELVAARLVACAQIGAPIESHYVWKGRQEQAAEVPLQLKTTRARFQAVEAAVLRLHSYEVPEIIATPIVAASPGYAAWVGAAVGEAPE